MVIFDSFFHACPPREIPCQNPGIPHPISHFTQWSWRFPMKNTVQPVGISLREKSCENHDEHILGHSWDALTTTDNFTPLRFYFEIYAPVCANT